MLVTRQSLRFGYKTIFKIEENDEDVADVVSAKVASHKHDANNGMAASH